MLTRLTLSPSLCVSLAGMQAVRLERFQGAHLDSLWALAVERSLTARWKALGWRTALRTREFLLLSISHVFGFPLCALSATRVNLKSNGLDDFRTPTYAEATRRKKQAELESSCSFLNVIKLPGIVIHGTNFYNNNL